MAPGTSLSTLLTRCTVLRTTSGVRVPSLVTCADEWAGTGAALSSPAALSPQDALLCCSCHCGELGAERSEGCLAGFCPLCVPAVLPPFPAGRAMVQPSCFLPAVMKTGESGLTVFRLLTKENRWKWVQANARLVYKNGKPEYIVVTQRPLVYVPGWDGGSPAFSVPLGCPERGRMLDLSLLLVPFRGPAVGYWAWCCSATSPSAG